MAPFIKQPTPHLHFVGESQRGKVGYFTCGADVPKHQILKLADEIRKLNPRYLAIKVNFLEIVYNFDVVKKLEENGGIMVHSTTQLSYVKTGVIGFIMRKMKRFKEENAKCIAQIFGQKTNRTFLHENPFSIVNLALDKELLYGENFDLDKIDAKEGIHAWATGAATSTGRTFLKQSMEDMAKMESLLDEIKFGHREIPGVTTPYFYLGVAFTTSSIHLEDFFLASINYLFKGSAIKYWLFIEAEYMTKLNAILQGTKNRSSTCPMGILHKDCFITTELLEKHKIPYEIIAQNPNEMIITFARGAHVVINAGKNVAIAMNWCYADLIQESRSLRLCPCPLPDGFQSIWEYIRGTEYGMKMKYDFAQAPKVVEDRVKLIKQQAEEYRRYHAARSHALQIVPVTNLGPLMLDGAALETVEFDQATENPIYSYAELAKSRESRQLAYDEMEQNRVTNDSSLLAALEPMISSLNPDETSMNATTSMFNDSTVPNVSSRRQSSVPATSTTRLVAAVRETSLPPSLSVMYDSNGRATTTPVNVQRFCPPVQQTQLTRPSFEIRRTVSALPVPPPRQRATPLSPIPGPSTAAPPRKLASRPGPSSAAPTRHFDTRQAVVGPSNASTRLKRIVPATKSNGPVMSFEGSTLKRTHLGKEQGGPAKRIPIYIDANELIDEEVVRRGRKQAPDTRTKKPSAQDPKLKGLRKNRGRDLKTLKQNIDAYNKEMDEYKRGILDRSIIKTRQTILNNDMEHLCAAACKHFFEPDYLQFCYDRGYKTSLAVLKHFVSAKAYSEERRRLWNFFQGELKKQRTRGVELFEQLEEAVNNKWRHLLMIDPRQRVPADDPPKYILLEDEEEEEATDGEVIEIPVLL